MSFLLNAVTPSSQFREVPTASIIDGRPTLEGHIPSRTQRGSSQPDPFIETQEEERTPVGMRFPHAVPRGYLSPLSSGMNSTVATEADFQERSISGFSELLRDLPSAISISGEETPPPTQEMTPETITALRGRRGAVSAQDAGREQREAREEMGTSPAEMIEMSQEAQISAARGRRMAHSAPGAGASIAESSTESPQPEAEPEPGESIELGRR